MEMSDSLHASAALPPVKRDSGTHWIGGWVGPRTDLDGVAKRRGIPCPCRKSSPDHPARTEALWKYL